MWQGMTIGAGVLLLGAAGVNFMVLQQYQKELNLRTAAKSNRDDSVKHLDAAKASHKDNDSALRNMSEAASEANRVLLQAKKETEDAKKKLDDDTGAMTKKKEEKEALDKKLAEYGGLKAMKSEMEDYNNKKMANEATMRNKQAERDLKTAKKAQTEALIAEFRKRDLMQKTGLLPNGLTARVSGMNPDAGFITIDKGNSSRVVKNAKFDVMRGGTKICTLVVTNVQPNSAVCDVVPGSMAAGGAVQPGDRVIVSDASSEKNLPPPGGAKPAEGAATPAPGGAAPAAPGTPAPPPAAQPLAPSGTPAPAPAPAPAPSSADPFGPSPAPAPGGSAPPAAPTAPAAPATPAGPEAPKPN
jgi:hypothetical protein